MKVAILQSNYLPWKGYFDILTSVDTFVFYDCVQYTKNDWRNRNVIYTKNGKQWLTIPVSSSAVKLSIDEVQLTDSRWQQLHAKSLRVGYSRAPFFRQLEEIIQIFYIDRHWTSLSELNIELISWICNKIGSRTVLRNAREFSLNGDRVERLVGVLCTLGATEYLSGPAAASYLDGLENVFQRRGIMLKYKSYSDYPEYPQISKPFESAVSIVDMIANLDWLEIPDYIKPKINH
jgi:hypothetical protein